MWAINPSVVDAQVALAGNEIDCFLNVADETKMGTNGVFYKEMEDYFYYAQLRR